MIDERLVNEAIRRDGAAKLKDALAVDRLVKRITVKKMVSEMGHDNLYAFAGRMTGQREPSKRAIAVGYYWMKQIIEENSWQRYDVEFTDPQGKTGGYETSDFGDAKREAEEMFALGDLNVKIYDNNTKKCVYKKSRR